MRMRRLGVAVVCLMSSACATLFSDGSQHIKVSSNVQGATVYLDNEPIGRTPMSFELERDTFKRHELALEYQGKRSDAVKIEKSLNTTSLFNCTSFLSWGTDALSGNMIEYYPESYFIEVQAAGAPQSARERQLMWFVVMNQKPILRDISRLDGPHLRAVAELSGVPPEAYRSFALALARRLPAMVGEEYPERLLGHVREVSASSGWVRRLAVLGPPTPMLSALGRSEDVNRQ